MKIKNRKEAFKPEQENNEVDEMQELDEEVVSQLSGGAGNPFADAARVPLQEITDDVRKRI